MNKFAIVISTLVFGVAINSYAQSGKFKESVGVTASGSTGGIGVDVYWNFMPHLNLRAGYCRMGLNLDFDITENNLRLDTEVKCRSHGFLVAVDYQFIRLMYATAGIGIFRFRPRGSIIPASDFVFGDISLSPETMGHADISVRNSAAVSPYLGVGFGRTVPSSNVSFAFEVGAFYMGRPEIKINATGMLKPNAEPEHANLLSRQVSNYRLYPIVKFSISVKLFTIE